MSSRLVYFIITVALLLVKKTNKNCNNFSTKETKI